MAPYGHLADLFRPSRSICYKLCVLPSGSNSNYDSSRVLYYRLISDGKVCGNDNVPQYASQVKTSR